MAGQGQQRQESDRGFTQGDDMSRDDAMGKNTGRDTSSDSGNFRSDTGSTSGMGSEKGR